MLKRGWLRCGVGVGIGRHLECLPSALRCSIDDSHTTLSSPHPRQACMRCWTGHLSPVQDHPANNQGPGAFPTKQQVPISRQDPVAHVPHIGHPFPDACQEGDSKIGSEQRAVSDTNGIKRFDRLSLKLSFSRWTIVIQSKSIHRV